MTTDARAAAWLTAWDCLQAAEACRKRALSDRAPEIAAQYRDAMTDLQRQAELFTALATAPESVGLECGIALERRRDADAEKAQMQRDLAEHLKNDHQ